MKRILISIGIIIIIIVAINIFRNRKIPDLSQINYVEVHIGGKGQEENTNLKFNEIENIKEVRRVHSKLNNYKDPKVKTWFLDVEIKYKLDSGKIKNYKFKNIRPVSDYFDKIYNSLEYRKQTNPIYKVSIEDITSVRIKDSYVDRNKEFETTNREMIEGLLNQSIKALDNYDNNKEYYTIANIDFLNGEELLASSMIFREQDIWYETLKSDKQLLNLYVNVDEVKEVLIKDDKSDKEITIDDRDTIRVILDNYFNWHSSDSSQYSVEIIMKDKTMRHGYGSFLKKQVPDEIVSLFE